MICEPLLSGPSHRPADEATLAVARRAAEGCGVTRLADITGLDRIGLSVWQAVRPAGRALSVHQGKGLTPLAAKIGALCEAMESHYAEHAPADGPHCRLDELPAAIDVPDLADLSGDRAAPPARDAPIQWCAAWNIATAAPAFLPHDLVSLDLTRDCASAFDRSSGGLGAGRSESAACEKAILELIENDAVGRWERQDILGRMRSLIDLESIPFAWFRAWRAHLLALDMQLRLCAVRAVTGHPVIFCALVCGDRSVGAPAFAGSACHGNAEIALFAALAEAIQSRLTFIAGSRDDFFPSQYETGQASDLLSVLPPEPPGFPTRTWSSLRDRPATLADLVQSLGGAGLHQILCKTLSPRGSGIVVVKAFVPGLGSLQRTARMELALCA